MFEINSQCAGISVITEFLYSLLCFDFVRRLTFLSLVLNKLLIVTEITVDSYIHK